MEHNIVSISGGKDSTATLAVAIVREVENLSAVFADTGNEHPLTYEYVDYLSDWLQRIGHAPIRKIKADFSEDLARRREYLLGVANGDYADKYGNLRHTPESAAEAAKAMQPTGSPFLDLVILKGRFPSTVRAFCSEELKRNPIIEQIMLPLMDKGHLILSWQGIRREESLRRSRANECEEVGGGLFNYRPILRWTAADVFEAHRFIGLKPNPLYSMGMSRVGCMPCINTRKDELREIADRFPEQIERIAEWERIACGASKRGAATFFCSSDLGEKRSDKAYEAGNIVQFVKWSRTSNGGTNLDLFKQGLEIPSCSSMYGLCE